MRAGAAVGLGRSSTGNDVDNFSLDGLPDVAFGCWSWALRREIPNESGPQSRRWKESLTKLGMPILTWALFFLPGTHVQLKFLAVTDSDLASIGSSAVELSPIVREPSERPTPRTLGP